MNYFEVDAVSNSKMSLINPDQGGSVFKFMNYDPYEDKPERGAFAIGTEVHHYALEPHKYKVSTVIKPNGQLGTLADYMIENEIGFDDESILQAFDDAEVYTHYKDSEKKLKLFNKSVKPFLENATDKDCVYVDKNKFEAISNASVSLVNSPYYERINKAECRYEEEIYFNAIVDVYNEALGINDKITIPCKAKIDEYSIKDNHLSMTDLKTSGQGISTFMGSKVMHNKKYVFKPGSFQKFRYYRQVAFYLDALLSTKDISTYDVAILVVGTTAPYEVELFSIDDDWIKLGRLEYMEMLKRIAYAKINGTTAPNSVLREGDIHFVPSA